MTSDFFGVNGGWGSFFKTASVPLSIEGTPVLTATDGTAYDGFTATASGGTEPYTYSLVGTWPTGITINSSTGEVSGTPTESGTFASLSVRVTDDVSDTADLDTFTIEVAASDPNFASVELLLGFEGSDGATSTTDESPDTRTVTFNDDAQLDTADFKFGASSLLLDGSGDSISVAHDGTAFTMSTADDHTFECFAKVSAFDTGDFQTLFCKRGVGALENYEFTFFVNTSQKIRAVAFGLSGTVVLDITGTTTVTSGAWHHFALSREGTTWRVFLNGTQEASGTQSSTPRGSVQPLYMGRSGIASAPRYLKGWMDEIRVTNGVARYTGNFTAPTSAFPRG